MPTNPRFSGQPIGPFSANPLDSLVKEAITKAQASKDHVIHVGSPWIDKVKPTLTALRFTSNAPGHYHLKQFGIDIRVDPEIKNAEEYRVV